MINVTFIVPYPELLKDVNKIFIDHTLRDKVRRNVQVIGADQLDEFIPNLDRDSEVLIARGYTAQRLELKNLGIPVVALPITAYDVIRTVGECMTRFSPRRVALVGGFLSNAEAAAIAGIFPCEFRSYFAASVTDVEERVRDAMADGCDAFIGGYSLNLCAGIHKMNSVIIKTGEAAIRQALDEAVRTVEIMRRERERSEMFTTITNCSKDGILYVSGDLSVRVANPFCAQVYGKRHEMTGESISTVFPFMAQNCAEVLSSGREIENHLYTHAGSPLSVNYFPVTVNERVTGVVITFQAVTQIQNREAQIRQKLSQKGHYARYTFDDIIHKSTEIMGLINTARRYAQVSSNVLIEGETGTGKELLAQSIHNASKRRSGPFVAVNCAAIPENLLESEMFGYAEGAFTGSAKGGKIGLFEMAHNGTLFLDELSELPIGFQSKLLRVLQEREVRPVGANKVKSVDVRIIAASNCSLKKLVAKGLFRQDLFYRLDVLKLVVPPLRRRRDDIEVLFEHFLKEYGAGKKGAPITVERRAAELLRGHGFEGNIRELRNIAERVSIMCTDSPAVTMEHMRAALYADEIEEEARGMRHAPHEGEAVSEKEMIVRALERCRYNQTVAARELSMDRSTLWRKIKKYNLPKKPGL